MAFQYFMSGGNYLEAMDEVMDMTIPNEEKVVYLLLVTDAKDSLETYGIESEYAVIDWIGDQYKQKIEWLEHNAKQEVENGNYMLAISYYEQLGNFMKARRVADDAGLQELAIIYHRIYRLFNGDNIDDERAEDELRMMRLMRNLNKEELFPTPPL